MIRPDVFVPGNHEFDFGKDVYLPAHERGAISRSTPPIMRQADGSPVPGMKDNAIIELGPASRSASSASPSPPRRRCRRAAISSSSRRWRPCAREAAALRKTGAEFIVCVAHTDRAMDNEIVRSRLVDVLLSGHDHDLAIGYDGKTVMVESNEEGNFVTAIDFAVTVSGEGDERKLSWLPNFRVHDSTTVEPDPEVQAVVDRARGRAVPGARRRDRHHRGRARQPHGQRALAGDRRSAISSPMPFAPATGADCAITNGGGIRANKLYPAGTS